MREADVDEAIEKAQQLMKFKHDKEFINKILDAQLRVNEIEQNILKNAGMSTMSSNTPIGKSTKKVLFQQTDSKELSKSQTN